MTYFQFLVDTGQEDGPESYISFLIEVCGYDAEYARQMAQIQYHKGES